MKPCLESQSLTPFPHSPPDQNISITQESAQLPSPWSNSSPSTSNSLPWRSFQSHLQDLSQQDLLHHWPPSPQLGPPHPLTWAIHLQAFSEAGSMALHHCSISQSTRQVCSGSQLPLPTINPNIPPHCHSSVQKTKAMWTQYLSSALSKFA